MTKEVAETVSDFAKVRAILDAATPGPWPEEYVEWAVRHIARNVDVPDWEGFPDFDWKYHDRDGNATHPDARAIVVARNLAPELLAVAEAAERADETWGKEGMAAAAEEVRVALDALHAKMKETL